MIYEYPTVEVEGRPLGDTFEVRQCQLEVLDGEDTGQRFVLNKPSFLIGTDPLCDLVLKDRTASRRHCELVAEGDGYKLVDLNSTNGTHLEGVRVGQVFLPPTSVFRAGKTRIRFGMAQTLEPLTRDRTRYGNIIGQSPPLRDVLAILDKVAPTDLSIVIEGETGTGKELIVRAIHGASRRASQPLEIFDCSAFPGTLLESELFGHERGAFSGAAYAHKGVFERADRGTIFFDELGEMDIEFQAKFLRALESGEIRRVGGERTLMVNVRPVAATNRNLDELIAEGRFRQDLFYRLAKVRFRLPPLRERPEDIPMLAEFFLDQMAVGLGHRPLLTSDAVDVLVHYRWPGNIRELRNMIERAATLCDNRITGDYLAAELGVRPTHVPVPHPAQSAPPPPPSDSGGVQAYLMASIESADGDPVPLREAKDALVSDFEKQYLEHLLEKHQQNISAAAREAQIDRRHFYRLLKKYDLMK